MAVGSLESALAIAMAIAMMVGGGGAPPLRFGRVAWSRLDPCTGSGTVLIGSGLQPRSSVACPALEDSHLNSHDTRARRCPDAS